MGEILQAILAITLIDLAMSGDNALVIGMVARGLPRSQRRRAIAFGAGAVAFLWTAPDLVLSEPALATVHGIPFVELGLTVLFLAGVLAVRFARALSSLVGARPAPAAAPSERRAS